MKPEFIFSAHDHKSYVLLTLKEDGKMLYYEDMKYNAFKGGISTWNFQAAKSTNYTVITEIVVPTCSYRMGSSDIGYGVIVHGTFHHFLKLHHSNELIDFKFSKVKIANKSHITFFGYPQDYLFYGCI